jgi:hypothetical protein
MENYVIAINFIIIISIKFNFLHKFNLNSYFNFNFNFIMNNATTILINCGLFVFFLISDPHSLPFIFTSII